MTGAHHIESFLEMLSAERGAAANTLAAYGHDLADFAAFAASRRTTLDTLGAEDIRAYLSGLSAAGMAASTAAADSQARVGVAKARVVAPMGMGPS